MTKSNKSNHIDSHYSIEYHTANRDSVIVGVRVNREGRRTADEFQKGCEQIRSALKAGRIS